MTSYPTGVNPPRAACRRQRGRVDPRDDRELQLLAGGPTAPVQPLFCSSEGKNSMAALTAAEPPLAPGSDHQPCAERVRHAVRAHGVNPASRVSSATNR